MKQASSNACRRPALLRCPGIALVLGLASLLHPGAEAWASPVDLFGVGGRSPALAGTGVADANDFDNAFLNPAGLADVDGKHITMGTISGDLFLYRNDARTDTDRITGIIIGGALRLPMGGVMRDRLGIGFGFQIPTAAINRARHPLPGVPVHVLLENRTQVVSIQAALGARILDNLQVGFGMMALAELRGTIDVTTDAAGRFTSFSEQQMIARIAPVVGVRYLLPDQGLSLGAVVRGVSRSDYDILVSNELGDILPVSIPTVRLAGASQYTPLTAALEARWAASDRLALSGQLAYQRWSAYAQPTTNPVPGGDPLPDHGFSDTVIPRLSVEWRPSLGKTELAVRGGYAFSLSPAPEMDGQQSLLDNHRHIVSSGLGLSWPGTSIPIKVDVWMQLHQLMPRTHEKDPTLFDPGQELPFDTMDTSGRILVGGLTMGVEI